VIKFRISEHAKEQIREKKIPQYIPDNGIAEVILLLNRETKESKINKLMEAVKDPLFMNDLYEITEDFKEIDKAGWE
jgi:hypothetical protein